MKPICNNPFFEYQFDMYVHPNLSQFCIEVVRAGHDYNFFSFKEESTMLEHFAFLLLSLGMSQSDVDELTYDQYGQVKVNINGMEITANCLPF